MKWKLKLGRFAGIDVFLHVTFFLMILWIGVSYWIQDKSLVAVFSGVGFILALFASVVLHEYGHALTARRYGIPTRDITLYPIGGVASLERIPEKPRQELWVALAGPAVNVVIAAVLYLVLVLTNTLEPITNISLAGGPFIERLMATNLVLVGFNLIPAFPMDGGRVLRALLALRLDYTNATRISASIGQGLAFLFGFIGLFSNPFLVFIAFFVYIGAQSEAQMVLMKSVLEGVPVSRAMLTDFSTILPEDTLGKVVDHVLAGDQKDFPAVADGQVVGILKQQALLDGLRKEGEGALVRTVMDEDFMTVDSVEMLDKAFTRLNDCACPIMPVLNDGKLVGLLTMDNIREFIRIQSMLAYDNRLVS